MDTTHFTGEPDEEKFSRDLNGTIPIVFTLADTSDVTIEIYDLEAEKCATITGKNLMAGEQEIIVNIINLGIQPGEYVCHLQITDNRGKYSETRHVTVL